MGPLADDKGGWGKRLAGIWKMGHLLLLVIKILPSWGYPLVSIHLGHKYVHVFCPFRELPTWSSSPNFLSSTSQSRFFQDPDLSAKPLATVPKSVYNTRLAISPFMWCESTGALLQVLPTGRISLPHHPSGMPQKGAVALQVVPAYHADPSVNQAQVFSSYIDCLQGVSHEATSAGRVEKAE